MPQQPDAVLVSGDLSDHGADAEYEAARATAGDAGRCPSTCCPATTTLRAPMRRSLRAAGRRLDEPMQYAVDLGPLRLVALDTTIPGEDAGALDDERLGWLDADARAASPRP